MLALFFFFSNESDIPGKCEWPVVESQLMRNE